jgi:hypothetical protein
VIDLHKVAIEYSGRTAAAGSAPVLLPSYRRHSTGPRGYLVASSQGIPVLATPYATASEIGMPIELHAADHHVSQTVVWIQWGQQGAVAAPLGVLPMSSLGGSPSGTGGGSPAPTGVRRGPRWR